MKALEKERSRRYDSSSALGEDIQRFLLGEAVAAAPPSRLYRLKKWYRRHRGTAIAGTTLLVSLLAGIGGTTWAYLYARQQQVLAEQRTTETLQASELAIAHEKAARMAVADTKAFANHLVDDFLKVARPEGWNGGRGIAVTVRDALLSAESQVPETFQDQPRAEAIARLAYGQTWHDLGDYIRAEANWRRILSIYDLTPESNVAVAKELWLEARVGLGHSLLKQSQIAEAKSTFAHAIEDFGVSRVDFSNLTWLAHVGLAEIDLLELRPQLTLDRLLPILAQAEKDLEANIDLLLQISTLVSSAYESLGQMDNAIQLDSRMLQLGQEKLGPDHAYTLILQNAVAQNHWKLREYETAIPQFRSLVESCARVFGAEHPTTLEIQINLAANLSDSGNPAEGETMFADLIPRITAKRGAQHEKTLEARKLLGIALLKQKKFDEAQKTLEPVWQDAQRALGEDHSETLRILSYFCESLQQAGKLNETVPYRETLLRLRRKQVDRQDPDLLPTMNNLASLYWRTGQLKKSIPLFREVVAQCQKDYGLDHRRTLQASANLAVNLRDDGQLDEAIQIMEQVFALSPKHSGLEWIADELLLTYLNAERLEAARPLLLEQEKRLRADLPDGQTPSDLKPLTLAHRQTALAENLVRQQRHAEAKPLLHSAIATYVGSQPNGWQLASARSLLAEALLSEVAPFSPTESSPTAPPVSSEQEPQFSAAQELLLSAHERLSALAEKDQTLKRKQHETRQRLQRLYELWAKPAEVELWKSKN